MTENRSTPTPPSDVPSSITDGLVELDDGQLRHTAAFIQAILDNQQPLSEEIEAKAGEEIVSTTEEQGYTAVVKRQPCSTGCEDCPHGPYLYHVRREPRLDGSGHLHWAYIGRVKE